MTSLMIKEVLAVTLLSLLLPSALSLSCYCFPITFKQQFCSSTVAVRARILAQTDNCAGTCGVFADQITGEITYIAKVQATFRGKTPEDGIMLLKTPVDSAGCGVQLTVGATYLVTVGEEREDKCPGTSYFVGLCGGPVLWTRVLQEQQMFVFRNAKRRQQECDKVSLPSYLE